MDKPKCWVKNVKKTKKQITVESESWSWVKNDIFTQDLVFFPYLTRIWVETTQHFLEFIDPNIHELKNDLW